MKLRTFKFFFSTFKFGQALRALSGLLFGLFLSACNIQASLQDLNALIEDDSLKLKMESSGGAYVNTPVTITATFNKSYADFKLSDLAITNATASTLSGGPSVYTFMLTPVSEGKVEISSSDSSYTLVPSSTLILNSPGYELQYDISAPAVPTITKSAPVASRSNVTNFVVDVSPTSAGDVVKVYSDASCSVLVNTLNATPTVTSVPTTLSSSGLYSLYATVTDRAGNVSACSSTFAQYTLDITAPNLSALSLSLQNPATSPNTALRPRIRASNLDDAVSVTLYRNSSCTISYGTAAVAMGVADVDGSADLADGNYNFYARLTDDLGNISSCSTATVNYILDTTAPVLTFSAPAANTAAQIGLTISGTCENGSTVNLSGAGLASPATTSCSAGTFSQAIVFTGGDGTKNIIVAQTDATGNIGSANRDFIKDTTPPTLAFSSPAANTAAQTGLTISGTCEAGLAVTLSGAGLASPTTTACSAGSFSQAIIFTTGDGTKNIVIAQTDAAGNTSNANRDFIKDTTGPIATLTGTPSNPSLDDILNITVAGTDVVNYKYKVGPALTTLCSLTGDYSASASIATLITDSLSSFYLYSLRICVLGQDAVGNWQDPSSATSYDWVHDLNPPFAELSNLPTSTSSAMSLAVSVSGVGVSFYKYKLGVAASTDCTVATDYSGDVAVATNVTDSISGLADGLIKLCVVGKDSTGNYQPYSSATSYSWTKNSTVPGVLSYSLSTVNFILGNDIGYYSPTISAGAGPFTYSVAPALPAGIVLNTSTGVVSGIPSALAAAQTYTITATNSQGATTYNTTIAVVSDAFTLALPTEGSAVSGYQVFSGVCTTGESVSVSQLSPTTSPVVATPLSAVTCRNGKYSVGVTIYGKEGRRLTVSVTQKNKSISRTVVFAPSGLAKVTGVNGTVASSAQDPVSGKIYIAGNFNAGQNSSYNRSLLRLHADGSIDSSFKLIGTGFNGLASLRSVAVDTNGKVYVAGNFLNYNGVSRNRIARLNSDGTLDMSFAAGTGFNGVPQKIVIDANGKVVVAGAFTSYNGDTSRKYIVRLNDNGSVDTSFSLTGTGFNGIIQNFTIDSSGKILVIGQFTSYNSIPTNYIARLNSDGTLDSGFAPSGSGFNSIVSSVAIDSAGKIYAGGNFTAYNQNYNFRYLVRLNSDGTVDSSFVQAGNGFNENVSAVSIDSAGRLLVAGSFTAYDKVPLKRFAILNADGTFYSDRNIGSNSAGTHFNLLPNGKTLFAAIGINSGAKDFNGYVLLNADGSVDTSFSSPSNGASGEVKTVRIETSGKLLVGGTFNRVAGTDSNYFARLNSDGTYDSSFNKFGSGFNAAVNKIVIDSNGKYLACGDFISVNGAFAPYLTRLNSDGSKDASFIVQGTGFSGACSDISLDSSGKIYVIGTFNSYNGSAAKVVRLNTDGTLDASFKLPSGTGFNGLQYKVQVDANDKVLVAGGFSSFNSDGNKKYLIRFNSDGSVDNSFVQTGTGLDSDVRALALDSTGKIYAGGFFTAYNGDSTKKYLLRLNSDGSLDTGFSVEGSGLSSNVQGLSLDSNGKIIATGYFTSVASWASAYAVRLETDGAVDYTFNTGAGFSSYMNESALKANGNIIFVGSANSLNKSNSNYIFELSPTGSLINTTISATVGSNLLALNSTTTVSGQNGTSPYSYSIMSGAGSINASTGVFTAGTAPGSSIIKVTDSAGKFAVVEISYTANVLMLTPANISVPMGGSYRLSASGGYLPYTFQVLYGGGSITSSGAYTAPSAAGLAKIRVTDAVGSYSDADVTITSGLALSPLNQNLYPNESVTFVASGGTAPYTYSVSSGAGSITSLTGVYTAGTNAGMSVIRVTDSVGLSTYAYVKVSAANSTLSLSPSTASVPVNASYSFGVVGGTAPYTFTVDSGVGTISSLGVYSSGGSVGSAVIRVTDSLSATATAAVSVNSALILATANDSVVVNGTVTVSASGGVPPYAYKISAGGGSVGSVSGIVTAPNSIGIMQVEVTDMIGTKKYLSLNVVENIRLSFADSSVARLSSLQGLTTGGITPYTYSIDSGVGTITSDGSYRSSVVGAAVVRVTDAVGNFATAAINVIPIVPTIRYLGLSSHYYINESSLNLTPEVLGDAATSFSISPSLPAGLTFNTSTGAIVGVPTIANPFTQYTVLATNASGSGSFNFSFSVVSAAELAVADPAESQTVSGYHVISGPCPVGSTVSVDSLDSGVNLITRSFGCVSGSYYLPVRISGAVNTTKVFAITSGNKTVTRTVQFNPTNRSFNVGFNGEIVAVAQDPVTGKFYVGGSFTSFGNVSVKNIARINTDGSLDTTFNIGTGFDGTVRSITIDSGGKLYVAGSFRNYNGKMSYYLTRLKSDGNIDLAFNVGLNLDGSLDKVIIDSNGKILIIGYFTNYGGTARRFIARLNTDGTLDTSFATAGTGFNSNLRDIAIDSNNKILVGGFFTEYNGTAAKYLVRLNSDGTLDGTYVLPGSGFNSSVAAIKLTSGDKLFVAGEFSALDSVPALKLVKLNSDGSRDNSFATTGLGFDNNVYDVNIDSTGKVIVAGTFTQYDSSTISKVARLNSDGSIDPSFVQTGQGLSHIVNRVIVDGSDNLIVASGLQSYDGALYRGLLKLNNGALDSSFTAEQKGFNSVAYASQVDSLGRLVVVGNFTKYSGVSQKYIMRFNTDGSVDNTFVPSGSGFDGAIQSLKIVAGDKIIVAGAFSNYNGTSRAGVARLNSDGSLDTSFVPSVNGFSGGTRIYDIAVDENDKVLIASNTQSYDSQTRYGLVRLNADGSADTAFNSAGVGGTSISAVYSIAIASNGQIYIGGSFQSFNGSAIRYLVRLNTDGTVDTSFAPSGAGFSGTVQTVAIDSNGKVVVGGSMGSLNSASIGSIVKLNSDYTLDNSFTLFTSISLYKIKLDSLDRIVVSAYSGITFAGSSLHRITPSGALDPTFWPLTGPDYSYENTIALDSNDNIYLSGQMNGYADITTPFGILKISKSGSLMP